jgi:hypothetical protein
MHVQRIHTYSMLHTRPYNLQSRTRKDMVVVSYSRASAQTTTARRSLSQGCTSSRWAIGCGLPRHIFLQSQGGGEIIEAQSCTNMRTTHQCPDDAICCASMLSRSTLLDHYCRDRLQLAHVQPAIRRATHPCTITCRHHTGVHLWW